MAVAAVGLYLVAVVLSLGFFIWAVTQLVSAKRIARRRQIILEMGPETDPAIFALYCQYLLAPQTALKEARRMMALAPSGRLGGHRLAGDDFFRFLDTLNRGSTASLR